jgi:hypothetical protein
LKKGDQGGFLEGPGHAEFYSPFWNSYEILRVKVGKHG